MSKVMLDVVPPAMASARVIALPRALYYVPEFISESEEALILAKISAQPQRRWTVLSHRKLQAHPSQLSPTNTLLGEPLPAWLAALVPRMHALGIWDNSPHGQPNHVLINEYRPSEGIMAHEDGPAYHPVVATVSLGAPIVLDIFEKGGDGLKTPRFRILQEPRSLLITTDALYTTYMHGIRETVVDKDLSASTIANWEQLGNKDMYADGRCERKVRTSLTYRDVLKVKDKSKLFGRGQK